MAFNRNCFVILITLFTVFNSNAQTIRYPVQSSIVLKQTAEDIAGLFQKAIPGSQFTTGSYTALPQSGFIFVYDSTIVGEKACRVESDGVQYIKFSAAEDNGLCFGIYQYIQQLGFRFYLPGSIWESIPVLVSPYKKTDTTYLFNYKYNGWFLSGGHNRWVMDNNNNYGWEPYVGLNGHNWSLYQRRNGMGGQYNFKGHRSDIIAGTNLATWQSNPCLIASHNNSRVASSKAVPDVNNIQAKELWSSIIEQKYTTYRNIILSNPTYYVNQFRSFNHNNFNVGIEVTDGAEWGNTKDNSGCIAVDYGKESDQQFTLANYTVQKIGSKYPQVRFQLYAYSTHADIPSAQVPIHEKLDIQLVPEVYQNLTSTNGLRNRWYNKTKNISEYNYLNLSGWSGETPAFDLDELKTTLQIAEDKKSQGLIWEASPAKFASLPFLQAVSKKLNNNQQLDSSLTEFCNNMFGKAGNTMYKLLQLWTDKKILAGGISNRYKLPLYFQLLQEADLLLSNEPLVYKERLLELKAYMHYLVMYYTLAADQGSFERDNKAAALCMYLARINKMQLVNSYYLISTITRSYVITSDFYKKFNVASGTAYLNGSLPLITASEIESDFNSDVAQYSNLINQFAFESTDVIEKRFSPSGVQAVKEINVQLDYTNGMDYYNRAEFQIKAPAAGSFTIQYTPFFEMDKMGYINFTVESTDRVLHILEDFSLDRNAKPGNLTIQIPTAGNYKLTVCSKYKSKVKLKILTNRNIFYKKGIFFGKATESYEKYLESPGYLYIPEGINKLYFSIGNSGAGGNGYKTAEHINNAFLFQDINGNMLKARFVTPNDSALFYIEIPKSSSGKFCRIYRKFYQYSLVFTNVNNYLWYLQPRPLPCKAADFDVDVVKKGQHCVVRLIAHAKSGQFKWEVFGANKTYMFENMRSFDLPEELATEAIVTLNLGENCAVTKNIGENEKLRIAKLACDNQETEMDVAHVPVLFPNPTTGQVKLLQNESLLFANQIIIYNSTGNRVAQFNQVNQFDISNLTPGIYWYQVAIKQKLYSGKLVKL